MGKKGTKRKNPGVGIDFQRAKYKVGRKVPKAANETDVSFKAHAISLPSQGVAQAKAAAAVTSRNLTLRELLGQCGHYSERVRRDALAGLAELLARHPGECRRHAASCMDRLAERVTDASPQVRAALRDVFARGVPAAYPGGALAPFLPLLLAHVRAALTHISEGVRRDGLALLHLLSAALPRQFLGAHLSWALALYSQLLGPASPSPAAAAPAAASGGGASGGGQATVGGRALHTRPLASLHKTLSALEQFLGEMLAAASNMEAAKQAALSAAATRNGGVLLCARSAPLAPAAEQQVAAALAQLGNACAGRDGVQVAAAEHVAASGACLFVRGAPIAGRQGRAGSAGALKVPGGAAAAAVAAPAAATGIGGGGGGAAPARGAGAGGGPDGGGGGGSGSAAGTPHGSEHGQHEAGLADTAAQLNARLQACWPECCPAQLASAPELAQVQCGAALLRCADALGRLVVAAGQLPMEQVRVLLWQPWSRLLERHLPAPLPDVPGPLQQGVALLNKAARPLVGTA